MTLRAKVLFVAACGFGFLSVAEPVTDTLTKGEVRVVSLSGSAKVKDKNIVVGDVVELGDWIQTGAASGVKLLMPDRSVVDIGPNTQFRVQAAVADATDGQLEFGSVRASIQKRLEGKTKFRVRTKSSVLSARGTEFIVQNTLKPGSKDQFVEQVTVKSGLVEMAVPGLKAVMMDAGKQITGLVKGGIFDEKSLTEVHLKADMLQKTFDVATLRDDTFQQMVVIPSGDRSPDSQGKTTLAHLGQDAVAGANSHAAKDPEGGNRPSGGGGTLPFRDQNINPKDQTQVGGLNNIGGSNAEKKLSEGVNLTVVFQL